jgi:hypothetical protein
MSSVWPIALTGNIALASRSRDFAIGEKRMNFFFATASGIDYDTVQ